MYHEFRMWGTSARLANFGIGTLAVGPGTRMLSLTDAYIF